MSDHREGATGEAGRVVGIAGRGGDPGGDLAGERSVWLTYAEAAKLLGVKSESVKRRAIARRWPRRPGNDGRTLVAVPAEVMAEAAAGDPGGDLAGEAVGGGVGLGGDLAGEIAGDNTGDDTGDDAGDVAALAEARERASRAEGEVAGLRELVVELRQAAAETGRRLMAVEAEARTKAAEAAHARERAARAEGELAGLRAARGFWARLFGR